MTDPCIRCGAAPVCSHDWLHCEPCWQAVCAEVEDAWLEEIGRLMRDQDVGFVGAVERLAAERGRPVRDGK